MREGRRHRRFWIAMGLVMEREQIVDWVKRQPTVLNCGKALGLPVLEFCLPTPAYATILLHRHWPTLLSDKAAVMPASSSPRRAIDYLNCTTGEISLRKNFFRL